MKSGKYAMRVFYSLAVKRKSIVCFQWFCLERLIGIALVSICVDSGGFYGVDEYDGVWAG